MSDEQLDALMFLIRAIARDEVKDAANGVDWVRIDPDQAADDFRELMLRARPGGEQ